jgi:phosphatidylethanolamine/phosphatidyl-N-methylethanolamine N-methyltransferase
LQARAGHKELSERCYKDYDEFHYREGLVASLFDGGIYSMERYFPKRQKFSRVLELGAGGPFVINKVRHQFDEYLLTDLRPLPITPETIAPHLKAGGSVITTASIDAKDIPRHLGIFDRIVASNLLEHLSDPEEVLDHWFSRLSANGVLSLLLPCDPGILWRFSREISARRHPTFSREEYRYFMAKEHINSADKLLYLLDYRFPQRRYRFFPFPFLPLIDFNFFVAVQIPKGSVTGPQSE